MPNYTVTPNMSLLKPIPGVDPGPEYATDQNTSIDILDTHDHSPGKGVPVTTDGISISADLSFNGNNATALRSARFTAQASPLALVTDLGCAYVAGVDLYFNDGLGNQVRITQSGGVAGSPGSISNLTAPASAAYVSASTKFVWESDANTAADMDGGSVLIREKVANAKAVTLASPTSLASNYQLTFPGALPASPTFLICDSSGNLSVPASVVDGTSLQQSGATLSVKDGGITRAKLAALGQQVSSSSGTFTTASSSFVDVTNLTVTLTTTGRPVVVFCQPDTATAAGSSGFGKLSGSGTLRVRITRDGTEIGKFAVDTTSFAFGIAPPSALTFLDVGATAGAHTYKVQAMSVVGSVTVAVYSMVLVAYENI